MSAYDCVMSARANDRPTAIDYITRIFGDSFFELHGDRRFADDKAIIGGIAELNGKPVTVIALEKGRNLKERMNRNFGSAHPEGYRKALRLMKQAEKFHRPVICFVDTRSIPSYLPKAVQVFFGKMQAVQQRLRNV